MTRTLNFALATTLTALTGACNGHDMGNMGGMEDDGTMIPEVDASEGPFEPTAAPDLDPAPGVVEVALEAKISDVEIAPGRTVSMWTYNGQLPGPRIEAHVGDTVRVRFKNSLPEATTIHWHGLRVPAAMDGSQAVQTPVAPGADFTYEFTVPDSGTFWYHPHVRSDEQVERGLYGAFIVRGSNEPTTTTDRTVVLDDVLVDENWQLAAFDPKDAMVGRQGNVILANGWANPIAHADRGGLHRFRFVNTANARYFRLALPGHKLIQIGTDVGFLPTPRELDELLLVPGERADILVVASEDVGEALEWKALQYDRGHGTGDLPEVTLFQFKLGDSAPIPTPAVPAAFAPIDELPAASVQRELKLQEMDMAGGGNGEHAGHGGATTAVMFMINDEMFPDVTPLRATLNDVEEWSVVNTTEMDHPFHLHGFRFQVTSVDGQAPGFVAWRDSINIPANETVKFRVRLEDHPGSWMFHCHILEHAERGMMGELEVVVP